MEENVNLELTLDESNCNDIRTLVVDQLDKYSKYVLTNLKHTDEWQEQMEFLSILVYNGILKCKYNKLDQQFEYETNMLIDQNDNPIKVSTAIQAMDANENGLLDLTGEFSEEQKQFQILVDYVMTELQDNRYYSIPAQHDEEYPEWADEVIILTSLVNKGYVNMDFCSEHMTFTYHLHDDMSLIRGDEMDEVENSEMMFVPKKDEFVH